MGNGEFWPRAEQLSSLWNERRLTRNRRSKHRPEQRRGCVYEETCSKESQLITSRGFLIFATSRRPVPG